MYTIISFRENGGDMNKTSKLFAILSYIYISLPILIFFIGWCNPPTAIVGTLVIFASLFFAFRNAPELWMPESKKQIFFLASLFVIALVWVYLSGIGAFAFQNLDHNCRNPIFELLVTQPWPSVIEHKNAILIYYIAFWLPSALVGKLFGSVFVGYCCQVLWASIGIFLFFYYVLAGLRKKNYIPIIIFIFFSGLDIIGEILTLNLPAVFNITSHIEWWCLLQFSSMTTQLFWVFNQAIAAWLIIPVLALEKNNKNMGFLYSCLFLHSTIPAIGMFPLLAYWCIKNGQRRLSLSGLKQAVISVFTFQNIIGSMCVFIVCYTYLTSNTMAAEPSRIYNWFVYPIMFFTFFTLEAGVYLLPLFKIYKRSLLYYIVLISLFIYPFFVIGTEKDFCMRATIPALIVLYLMVCKVFELRYFRKKCKLSFMVLIVVLLIGAVTPIHEIARSVILTSLGVTKVQPDLSFYNFSGHISDNRFLKYFGKPLVTTDVSE